MNLHGIEHAPPAERMLRLNHWAKESVHNMGVLVSWPPGRGQISCNYSTPPPNSKHPCTYTIVGGGGGVLPARPLPLNTCSHNTATRRPPHPCNTQQNTRTPNNRQQHTTTVHNSTHKITNVPLCKKLWGIIFFCRTITLWAISMDILRAPQNVTRNGS